MLNRMHIWYLQNYLILLIYVLPFLIPADPVVQKVPVVHTVERKVPVPVHKPVPVPVERKVPVPVHVPGKR